MTVIDVDALRDEALATEEGQQFAHGYKVRCRGIEFRVPPVSLWPVAFFRAQASGDQYGAIVSLLGEELAGRLADAGMVLDDLERIATTLPRPGGVRGPSSARPSAPGS